MEPKSNKLLLASVACLFSGRAFLAYFGNPAVVQIVGFEGAMKPIVSIFMSWDHFSLSVYPVAAEVMSSILFALWILLFFGLWLPGFRIRVLLFGGVLATMEVLASLAGEYYWLWHFAARALVCFTPLLFLLILKQLRWVNSIGRILVAFVFLAHGAFALNILPLPGSYEDMFVLLLDLHGDAAVFLLRSVGVIDIGMALVLISFTKVPAITWIWMVCWGTITAIARLASQFDVSLPMESLGMGLGDSLIRMCHGLVPWALAEGFRSGR